MLGYLGKKVKRPINPGFGGGNRMNSFGKKNPFENFAPRKGTRVFFEVRIRA